MIVLNLSNNLKAFTYENICTNGNFYSATGWITSASTLSTSNNKLIVTGTGTAAGVQARFNTIIPATTGKKIFLQLKMKVTNSICTSISSSINATTSGTSIQTAIQTNPTQDEIYTLSGIASLTGLVGNIQIRIAHSYSSAANATGKIAELQECLCIDLTALYGAGNEPSAADCANIFRFVDGTKQPNFSKQIAI